MSTLQQKLQEVHEELTRVLAESKLDAATRRKIASLANKLSRVRQKLTAETAEQTEKHSHSEVAQERRSLIRRVIDLLTTIITTIAKIYHERL